MSKITPEHLARQAVVSIEASRPCGDAPGAILSWGFSREIPAAIRLSC
jgi:hypothetical protein